LELSVIMPCHNEAPSIRSNLERTLSTLDEGGLESFEIIPVDDGSDDGTFREISSFSKKHPQIRPIGLDRNFGKGHALKMGFYASRGRLVAFLDGDLDLSPDHVLEFLDAMEESGSDVVIGSKRHTDSKIDYPHDRRLLSTFYHFYIHTLFGLSISDSQVGVKLFRREVLDDVFSRVLCKKYAFDIELLVNINYRGYTITEAPVEMDFKSIMESGVNKWAVMRMLVDTLAIFYRLNLSKYYDRHHADDDGSDTVVSSGDIDAPGNRSQKESPPRNDARNDK